MNKHVVIGPIRRLSAPQIRSTILALYKLVCMYVCTYNLINRWVRWHLPRLL